MLIKKTVKQLLFLLLFITTSQFTFASEDAYLKQLEMEANATSEKDSSTVAPTEASNELVVDKKELIKNVASFERALKREHLKNYAMYQDFTDEQKKEVYNFFLKNKRLYDASIKVTLIYIKSH